MATATEEDVDYESDPEEAKRSLAMRRREASDDEEGEGSGRRRAISRVANHSDESDGQGGADEYEDEDELGEEIDEENVGEEGLEEVEVEEDEERYGDRKVVVVHGEIDGSGNFVKELEGESRGLSERPTDLQGEIEEEEFGEEEEKKVNEPFAVPTAGAFYMHDDRFRDNAGGRNRRTHGGRRLWESKDDMKWGHDKFEELTLQEGHRDERRTSKGHPRGRGKNRGMDHGYARENRSRAYNKSNTQNNTSKVVRGRGPRRYEPTINNNNRSSPQEKQFVKPPERASHYNTGRSFAPPPNVEGEPVSVRKHVIASSLNSASPPFYPSGASVKNVPKVEKRDVQAGLPEKNIYDDSRSMPQSNARVDRKQVVEVVGMERLYMNDSTNPTFANPMKPSSGSSVVNNAQMPHSRAQGRGGVVGSTNYPPSVHNHVNKVSLSTQSHGVARTHGQNRAQSAGQVPVQQLGQRPGSGSQSSSPPKTSLSVSSFDSGDMESSSESGKLKTALVGKGKGVAQGIGSSSFIYGGAQIMAATGSMNITPGDQNFPHTPAFLPVMQFGGQHGVPAVGMAFPGYVAQSQLGMGNSEMTWLPVLAGAAGALGATYCPPYIAVDGSYHARPSGQTSSVGTMSKENNTNKSSNESKASQNELENDEAGQRQNKPRRYSEMNFGQ